MYANNYVDKQVKRIAHIKSHVEAGVPAHLIDNIANNRGDPRACADSLASFARGKAMLAWFDQHNLIEMRNWWYISAKMTKMKYELAKVDTLSPGGKFLEFLAPLLSNHEPLINWFAHHDQNFDMKRIEDHKTHDFWAYQGVIALRGEWPRLVSRCERVITDPPKDSSMKKYLSDHQFYLALANRDIPKMEDALGEMLTPKNLAARGNSEGGFTEHLISTPAVIFAKLAWRYGCQVKVNSPFIPQEWLPTDPLENYDNYYSFLN